MNKFGVIKSKIERALVKSYGKESFKNNIKEFKNKILGNKNLSEAYFLYDELNSQKGLTKEIASEYINESFEKLNVIINNNKKEIDKLSKWVESILKESVKNNYELIDTILYEKNISKLEKVVECKLLVQKTLTETKINKIIKESVNLPLSVMLKIASNTFNKEYENISESEKNELKGLLSLSKKEISEEILTLKESITIKLQESSNKMEDKELESKIGQTIQKINESKNDLVSLYKLRELNSGL